MALGSRLLIPAAAAAAFAATWILTPVRTAASQPAPVATSAPDNVFYTGCDEVRAAGKAPLYQGQPGYREGMDGDLDGIACEPHRHDW